jgi:hypothetical protein
MGLELVIIAVAYWLVDLGKDVSATVRGETPPSEVRRNERHKARMAAGGGTGAGGGAAARYVGGRWDDAWEKAHAKREASADLRKEKIARKAAAKAAKQREKWDRADAGETWVDRLRDKFDAAYPDRPSPFDATVPDAPADGPTPASPGTIDPATGGGERPTSTETPPDGYSSDFGQPEVNDVPAKHDDDAGYRLPVLKNERTANDKPWTREEREEDTAQAQAELAQEKNTPDNVVQLHPTTTNDTPTFDLPDLEFPMPDGEITGLDSAINYAEKLAAWCTNTFEKISAQIPSANEVAQQCEGARSQLESAGVKGTPLQFVTGVQEGLVAATSQLAASLGGFEQATAQAHGLVERLRAQTAIQEQHRALNGEGGDAAFYTGE